MKMEEIKLVVTVAFKEELPVQWLRYCGAAVVSLKSVLSSDFRELRKADKGIVFLVTGPGRENSLLAINWIKEHLRPLFVLNIGGAGVTDETLPLGQWYMPEEVVSEDGQYLKVDQRLPVPFEGMLIRKVFCLYTSIRPVRECSGIKTTCLVDMEAYWQARGLQGTGITFHCLKFATDRAGPETDTQYKTFLERLRKAVKRLLRFLECPRPSFTVIIPTKDRANRLIKAIESVNAQVYPPARIIVVDDGSTDDTKRLLKGLSSSVTRVFLCSNYGVSRAREVGVLLAETDWLAFLDSDDLWQKDKLQRQAEFIQRYPFFEVLQSEEVWIRKGRRVNPCKHHKKPEGWAWPEVLYRCLISPSGVVLRRELFHRYGGFREDFPVCEDYDLWLRVTRHKPVGLVKEPGVVKFGGHEDQLSRAYPAMDRFRFKSLLEAYLKEEEDLFRKQLREALRTKAEILLKGAMKRDLSDEVKYYRLVLEFIERDKP